MSIFKVFAAVLILLALDPYSAVRSAEQPLLIGTNASENGIFASKLNLDTGELSQTKAVGDAPYPGFLALHPRLPLVYCVTREKDKPAGGLRSFRIGASADSELTLINQQPTGDEGATHLALDPTASAIVVAHYTGGSTAVVPLDEGGSLNPLAALIKHSGQGADPKRQEAPHAHGVAFDTSGQFACVADLGTDEVIVYRLANGNKLVRHSAWKAAAGAGPRHVAFHPNGHWLFCLNELNATMSVLAFDSTSGELTELQTIGTLPVGFNEHNTTAEVVVHPSGKFVYGSNRGHDSTAAFAIDGETGRLTLIEIEPTQGGHPRFIGIEPSGRYLITANRDSNNLVSFRIDQSTGALTPTGHKVTVPSPVCVVFPSTLP